MNKQRRDSGPNIPEQECPYCHHTVNAAGKSDETELDAPHEHDGSVCINCGEILIFDKDLRLRKPYGGEIERLMDEEPDYIRELQALQRRIRSVPFEN